MDSLEITDQQSAAVQKTPYRVTLESIKDKIERVDYINPEIAPQMTIALVKMCNGFIVVGKAAPADPANFNKELGEKFAYEDAIRQVWPLEGYALCNFLMSTPDPIQPE
jgi:Phage protein (N4 Gp49/phage Sf6 gene 66) family